MKVLMSSAIGATLLLSTFAIGQSVDEYELKSRVTNRVIMDVFITSSTTWPIIGRDENLYNECQEVGNDYPDGLADWTSPFQEIYHSLWEHYTYNHTVTLSTGQWLEVTDEYKYSAYGTGSEFTSQGNAREKLTYDWYNSDDDGETFGYMGEISFARSERTWLKRETTYVVKSPESTGGGGAG